MSPPIIFVVNDSKLIENIMLKKKSFIFIFVPFHTHFFLAGKTNFFIVFNLKL
jgi:hypothetical protein